MDKKNKKIIVDTIIDVSIAIANAEINDPMANLASIPVSHYFKSIAERFYTEQSTRYKKVESLAHKIAEDFISGGKGNPNVINFTQTAQEKKLYTELEEQAIRKIIEEPIEQKQIFIGNVLRNIVTYNNTFRVNNEKKVRHPLDHTWGHKAIQIASNMTLEQIILFRWLCSWIKYRMHLKHTQDDNHISHFQIYSGGDVLPSVF